MFTFTLQLFDFVGYHNLQPFLVYYFLTWLVLLIRLHQARKYKGTIIRPNNLSVSVIIPVVDENETVFKDMLDCLEKGLKGLKSEVVVIFNGYNGKENQKYATQKNFQIIKLEIANKREAICAGVQKAQNDILFILDSDTRIEKEAISNMLSSFSNPEVGGATGQQRVFERNKNKIRLICDWLEDIRINNTLKGQSINKAVSCLPGRMLAIRTELAKKAMPEFLNEYFFKFRCGIGDDRFLSSWLLKNGWKTVYNDKSIVYTEAPDNIKKLIKQRVRWQRSSFRETLMALRWIWKYPFMTFTLLSDILIRWGFFTVVVLYILKLLSGIKESHLLFDFIPFLNQVWLIIILSILSFFLSAYLKQIPHLKRYPKDILWVPLFQIIITFVIMPAEWFGNITCYKNHWMTRKV